MIDKHSISHILMQMFFYNVIVEFFSQGSKTARRQGNVKSLSPGTIQGDIPLDNVPDRFVIAPDRDIRLPGEGLSCL
jgi:hypothetical protein